MHARHEEIDHTADVGIHVHGSTFEALCIESARAMFHLILEEFPLSPPTEKFRVTVCAENRELLLRAWLAELLYIHATKRVFLTDFLVESCGNTGMAAVAHGLPMNDSMIERATEIKAVTYHALSLTESAGELHAQVIFDT